jgi:hypothetical protein
MKVAAGRLVQLSADDLQRVHVQESHTSARAARKQAATNETIQSRRDLRKRQTRGRCQQLIIGASRVQRQEIQHHSIVAGDTAKTVLNNTPNSSCDRSLAQLLLRQERRDAISAICILDKAQKSLANEHRITVGSIHEPRSAMRRRLFRCKHLTQEVLDRVELHRSESDITGKTLFRQIVDQLGKFWLQTVTHS